MIHPTDDPRVLLIDEAEGSHDPDSMCWIHYTATAVLHDGRFEITQLPGQSQQLSAGQRCPAVALSGPFYATVHLSAPYDGQPLVDTADGKTHRLLALVTLADAPAQFR